MKRYQLKFDPDALKEWHKLDGSIKREFLPQLLKRLESPILESARLHGELSECFKIKSKKSEYRLIYTVQKNLLVVVVVSIGKRERLAANKSARTRLP